MNKVYMPLPGVFLLWPNHKQTGGTGIHRPKSRISMTVRESQMVNHWYENNHLLVMIFSTITAVNNLEIKNDHDTATILYTWSNFKKKLDFFCCCAM